MVFMPEVFGGSVTVTGGSHPLGQGSRNPAGNGRPEEALQERDLDAVSPSRELFSPTTKKRLYDDPVYRGKVLLAVGSAERSGKNGQRAKATSRRLGGSGSGRPKQYNPNAAMEAGRGDNLQAFLVTVTKPKEEGSTKRDLKRKAGQMAEIKKSKIEFMAFSFCEALRATLNPKNSAYRAAFSECLRGRCSFQNTRILAAMNLCHSPRHRNRLNNGGLQEAEEMKKQQQRSLADLEAEADALSLNPFVFHLLVRHMNSMLHQSSDNLNYSINGAPFTTLTLIGWLLGGRGC
jgi:hypothetical protein